MKNNREDEWREEWCVNNSPATVLVGLPPLSKAPAAQLYVTITSVHYGPPQGASSDQFWCQTTEGNRNRAPGRRHYGPGLRGTLVQLWWSSACRSGGSHGDQRSAAGQLSPSAGYLQQDSLPLVLQTPAHTTHSLLLTLRLLLSLAFLFYNRNRRKFSLGNPMCNLLSSLNCWSPLPPPPPPLLPLWVHQ